STQLGPCTLAGAPNEQSNACFYAQTPDTVEKAWGTIDGPNHNDVQGQPACPSPPGLCTYGVYGYLAWPTIWLVAQLMDGAAERAAFVAGRGEFFTDNASWS